MKNILVITYFYLCNLSYFTEAADNLTLELVQVLFRHGDRYPDSSERTIDKTDAYNHIFTKNFNNYGKLTKKGMLREYNFGKMLRQRYDDFLGPYKPNEVYARSTNFDRTKRTLLLALSGLYPPTEETAWWQIPTHANPRNADFLRVTVNGECVQNGKLLAEIDNSTEVKEKIESYRDFYEELKNKIYITDFQLKYIFNVYSYFRSLLSLGETLPDWCTQEDYKKLEELMSIRYESFRLNAAFRKGTAGPTIDQFLHNIENQKFLKRKIYLYAAHDINVSTFVQAHNFTGIPSIPDFGSGVIIETLRGEDGQIYLKMFYWTGVSEELILIKLKTCDHVCLLAKYREAVEPMIPNDEEKMCFSPLKTL